MALKSDFEKFRDTAIGSSGKIASILILIDRAKALLREAKEDVVKRETNIVKTQNILAQLEMALNFREGAEASNLFLVYDFLFEELDKRDDHAIDTCDHMLTELRETLAAVKRRGAV